MRLLNYLAVAVIAPISGLAAPTGHVDVSLVARGENLCKLSAPPKLCTPDPTVGVEETAKRAQQFFKAFVVDGDARTMFSLIDSTYLVRCIHLDSTRRLLTLS